MGGIKHKPGLSATNNRLTSPIRNKTSIFGVISRCYPLPNQSRGNLTTSRNMREIRYKAEGRCFPHWTVRPGVIRPSKSQPRLARHHVETLRPEYAGMKFRLGMGTEITYKQPSPANDTDKAHGRFQPEPVG